MAKKKMTFGLIVGNRGFFPGHLAKSGREEMIGILNAGGYDVVCPTPEETKYGAVETREEAKKCAALFRAASDKIDGVIITLPNFGEERGLVEALRLAEPERAGAGSGHAGHRRQDDHRRPPRQLLRQDERLQQPSAVPHPLLADDAAHRSSQFGGVQARTSTGSRPSAGW